MALQILIIETSVLQEQESTPSPSDHARTRSNLHRRSVKSSREHRRCVSFRMLACYHGICSYDLSSESLPYFVFTSRLAPDEQSAFEVEYTVRESRSRYSSSRDASSTHSRKHHRPAR
jgi:hypothetical protein